MGTVEIAFAVFVGAMVAILYIYLQDRKNAKAVKIEDEYEK